MNILCIIDSLGPGGAQRQLVELAKGFKEKGHDVSFLVYYNFLFYKPFLDKEGISITCIQESSYIKRLIKIRHFIRKGRFDSVLSFLEGPCFISEIAGFPYRKWKLVVGERSANPKIKKNLKLLVYRWFHIFANYVVSNSVTNDEFIRSINPLLTDSKCKVIYNIVDFNYWKPIKEFSFRKNKKLKVIVVATVCWRKNLNGLIKALTLLTKTELNQISFDWYGSGMIQPFYDESTIIAINAIKSFNLENVISFYPETHDIKSVIQNCDAMGLFSFYEGIPNVVCEGMACGKPMICTAVSDLPKILAHQNDLLCDPADPKSIADSIRNLINLNSEQLCRIGKKNEEIVKRLFKREIIIEDYLQLFQKKKLVKLQNESSSSFSYSSTNWRDCNSYRKFNQLF